MAKPTCFLIDDDEDDREIFEIALQNATGLYECITAKNGYDAIAMLKDNPGFNPDFIFLDLNMPLMHGKECLEHIKSMPGFLHIPVIIYTTSSYSKDIEDTKQLGAAHFLVKPPGLAPLTQALKRIVNKEALPYCLDGTVL